MPTTETVIRVFVASPSDLVEERRVLESVINELNITWSKTFGIRLDLIKWETHTYPSIGVDAQAVINEQIAEDYDVFIGLMWARFGTPTNRAGSGTAEEFYRAYKRYQEDPNQVRVLFYFKDAPIAPSELDPEQLTLVKKFKQDIGEKGAIYRAFTTRDEFTQLVRMHLGSQVQEWGKNWGIGLGGEHTEALVLRAETNVSDEYENNMEEGEEGFFDLLETGQDNFTTLNEVVSRMTIAMQDLGSKTSEGAKELTQSKSSEGIVDFKQAKRVTNRIAEALNNFAALMEVDVPIFAASLTTGIESFTGAFTLTEDFPQDEESIIKAGNTIKQLRVTMAEAKENMQGFRHSIAVTPRATTLYNRAKKRALSILDRLDEEFATGLNLTSELEALLEQYVKKIGSNRTDLIETVVNDPNRHVVSHPATDSSRDASEEHDNYILAQNALAQAYNENEPEYSINLVKELNPDYEGR